LPETDPNFRGVVLGLIIVIVVCAMGLAIDFIIEQPG
jgi:hypothetical protein